MSVPTYDRFIEPVLRYLAAHPEGVAAIEAREAAANALNLTDADRQLRLPSGIQLVYRNRAGWAHDRLKRAGLSSSPRWGVWKITPEGERLIAEHPSRLPDDVMERITSVALDKTLEEIASTRVEGGSVGTTAPAISAEAATVSPEERLGGALEEIRGTVTAEILDLLGRVSPSYFETVVLDVLHRMGYGTSRADALRVGGSGDGGIDGVISLDRLGLEKVYVQAKRWQGAVGRPEVQGFFGALAGQRANKGVFITTSTFTAQAIDFVRSVERIVLVDGKRLAQLMIDHEVGVTSRTISIPRIDSDYFEE
jgi:restriction system protein